jgi:hypothetical protein
MCKIYIVCVLLAEKLGTRTPDGRGAYRSPLSYGILGPFYKHARPILRNALVLKDSALEWRWWPAAIRQRNMQIKQTSAHAEY